MATLADDDEAEPAWLQLLASTELDESESELDSGTVLCGGRYVVRGELGRGGMGVVYAAWDEERRTLVALKTLTGTEPDEIYRIKREFRGLVHVLHRNLVRLHELFEDGGRWFFSLELVPGDTLLRALQGAPPQEVRAALAQLAEGIGALHAAGKLHRDLKPSNVMLTPEGRVVILDFGLSEDIRKRPAARASDRISGTPGYMAPELSTPAAASPASDWYAFGVILRELFGGSPYGAVPVGELRSGVSASAPTPWSRFGQHAPAATGRADDGARLPEDLAPLCQALLSADPCTRPAASEVIRTLASRDAHFVALPAPHFLGRAPELEQLRAAHAASRQGRRPVVLLLSGESGIGKTALVQAFLAELGEASVLVGRCYERELVPFKAFDAAIDELCRQLDELEAAQRRALLPPDFAALCRLFPVLGRVRDATVSEPLADDIHELRRRGFEALGALLERLQQQRPVVLWLDDLQWMDEDSSLLLLHLLRQSHAPRILFIASHRREAGEPPCLEPLYRALGHELRLDVRRIELGALGPADAAALLESVSPGAPRAVVERARGNPFLLEELSRHAARRAATSDTWPTLEEAIASRVDGLPSEERRVLELLAFAGRPLSEALGRSATGVGWHAALQVLLDARLARRSGVDGSLNCYHDAVRASVVAAAPLTRARLRHRALARALLRSASAQPEQLARHLAGAGHPAVAARQTAVAAAAAAATLAFERSAQLYDEALRLGRFSAEQARGLRLERAHALSAAGHGSEAAALYLEVAGRSGAGERVELHTRAAEQYLLSGRLEQGLELLRSALGQVGLGLPMGALSSLASFAYHRVRLWLRGHGFEPRPVSAASVGQLRMLQRATVALLRLDPLRGCDLASRLLLLALQAGSRDLISTGYVGDLVVAILLRAPAAELQRRQARAREAIERFGGASERAMLHSALATAARLKPVPDLPEALRQLEQFFLIHGQHALPRASYERPWQEWARSVVRCLQGEFEGVARDVPARLDEAWARGDHCVIPLWAGGDPLLARVAVGDAAAAKQDLLRARRLWSSGQFTLQDLMLALGEFHLALYEGQPERAWQAADLAAQRLARSALRRMPNAVDTLQALRGHAALELAASAAASERKRWLELARRIGRRTRRQPNLAATVRGHLLEAAWRHQRGESEQSLAALERAEPPLATIPLYLHATRYRRGLLLGGSEGAELVTAARGFLRSGGAVEPERLLDVLLPGYAR